MLTHRRTAGKDYCSCPDCPEARSEGGRRFAGEDFATSQGVVTHIHCKGAGCDACLSQDTHVECLPDWSLIPERCESSAP